MEKVQGLYVLLLPDGKIKKTFIPITGDPVITETTIAEELMEYVELNYAPFSDLVTYLEDMSFNVFIDEEEVFEDIDMHEFEKFLNVVDELVRVLKETRPISGNLLQMRIQDVVPEDDGSAMYPIYAKRQILLCLEEMPLFQMTMHEVLFDLVNGIPFDKQEKYEQLRRTVFTQVSVFEEQLVNQYYFNCESEYCQFLLLHFIDSKQTIARCLYCGQFFIPKTKKKTLYCDRIVRNGKTCKQEGPRAKHVLSFRKDNVIQEFDRTQQKLYKRFERTQDGNNKSGKALSIHEYWAWYDRASAARDSYLEGKITEEEAIKAISAE